MIRSMKLATRVLIEYDSNIKQTEGKPSCMRKKVKKNRKSDYQTYFVVKYYVRKRSILFCVTSILV